MKLLLDGTVLLARGKVFANLAERHTGFLYHIGMTGLFEHAVLDFEVEVDAEGQVGLVGELVNFVETDLPQILQI